MNFKHLIVGVEKHSIAHKLHIKKGDKLLKVNGETIRDIFDYQFLIADEYVTLEIEKANGKVETIDIEKDFNVDIGLEFESSLMDEYQSCCNKCVFCFIDQMPKGMRDTLYFKDDDSRLSFLQGNYVTLTNMSDADIDRIVRYHMEPINVSVHTTNPDLRCKMLNNRFAGDVLKYIDRLYEAGIHMNGQIVLCKGLNDGEELKRTIGDLMKYAPVMQSVSVVPVGLTKFREGLYPLESLTSQDAATSIDIIESFQKEAFSRYDLHFIHASDEFYLLAGRNMPEEERYDGYMQLENGVGMTRLLNEEFKSELEYADEEKLQIPKRHFTVVTGVLAEPNIKALADTFADKYSCRIDVRAIINHFFGEQITVSGLICGCDLIEQLKGLDLGEEVLIPINMLRSGERYFLDDITIEQAETELNTRITIVPGGGESLFRAFAGEENTDFRRQIYEQADSGDCWKA